MVKLCIYILFPGTADEVDIIYRPKVLCTKAVFYVYILLIAILFVVIIGFLAGAIVFPAYSLYVSPYLPTQQNLNNYQNTDSRSFMELSQDLFLHRNFSTDSIPLPYNYARLLNITIEHGMASISNCSDILEEGKDFLTLINDVKSLSENKDAFLASFPSVDTILSGLNATFSPYYDYLPLQVPLVQSVVTFLREGNYTLPALKQFVDDHYIFASDVMQLRIVDIVDIVLDPLSLFNATFIEDVKALSTGFAQNVTDVGTSLYQQSSEMYNRTFTIVTGFINNEDLEQYSEIPTEYIDMFEMLQSKFVYYQNRVKHLVDVVPQFGSCMSKQGAEQTQYLKSYLIANYIGYFKKHYFYTILVIVCELLLIALFVWMIVKGISLAKETLAYAKSLLVDASVNTINTINDFGRAVKEKEK